MSEPKFPVQIDATFRFEMLTPMRFRVEIRNGDTIVSYEMDRDVLEGIHKQIGKWLYMPYGSAS